MTIFTDPQRDKDKRLLGYYVDNKAKIPAPGDLKGNAQVRFLTAKQEPPVVGRDTVTTTLYVRNEHDYAMELKPTTTDPDLTITQYPHFLEPDKMGKVELTFKPSAERIAPLSASWDFIKIVYAKEDQPQA